MHTGDDGDPSNIASGTDALGASSQADALDILLVDDEPDIEIVAATRYATPAIASPSPTTAPTPCT
jgi:hypothetical protein